MVIAPQGVQNPAYNYPKMKTPVMNGGLLLIVTESAKFQGASMVCGFSRNRPSLITGALLLTVLTKSAKISRCFFGLRILSPPRLVNTSRLMLTVLTESAKF